MMEISLALEFLHRIECCLPSSPTKSLRKLLVIALGHGRRLEEIIFMVTKLFLNKNPTKDHILLDPGCGHRTFIKAVVEWCKNNDHEYPMLVGVESDGILEEITTIRIYKSKQKYSQPTCR
jgi:hypothetical protein